MTAEEKRQVRKLGAHMLDESGCIHPHLLWVGRIAAGSIRGAMPANVGRVDHGVALRLQPMADELIADAAVCAAAMIDEHRRAARGRRIAAVGQPDAIAGNKRLEARQSDLACFAQFPERKDSSDINVVVNGGQGLPVRST